MSSIQLARLVPGGGRSATRKLLGVLCEGERPMLVQLPHAATAPALYAPTVHGLIAAGFRPADAARRAVDPAAVVDGHWVHTWAVNEIGVQAVMHAGPGRWWCDWRSGWSNEQLVDPSVAGGWALVADAVLELTDTESGRALNRWVEVDRMTRPRADMVGKLARYQQAFEARRWQKRFDAWPTLMIVIGASDDSARAVEDRCRFVLDKAAELCSFPVMVASFERVVRAGIAGGVFDVSTGEKANLLGPVDLLTSATGSR